MEPNHPDGAIRTPSLAHRLNPSPSFINTRRTPSFQHFDTPIRSQVSDAIQGLFVSFFSQIFFNLQFTSTPSSSSKSHSHTRTL
ncbi:hypothetical protein HanPI659440_Chr01g0027931 [Helianthus annuus]|nr:hypothetical protein HanPI659440_Chr01g0027931 [Helianthus annuus]